MGRRRTAPIPTARRTKSSRTLAYRDTRRERHRVRPTSRRSGPKPSPGPPSTPTDRSDTFERAALGPPAAARSAPALRRAAGPAESTAAASQRVLEWNPFAAAPEAESAPRLVLEAERAERADTARDTRRLSLPRSSRAGRRGQSRNGAGEGS